ncbi:MAG: hypothetical protein LBK07_09240 [Tannerella sp.]|nr:hypothetical protein [Tannerella sp.]
MKKELFSSCKLIGVALAATMLSSCLEGGGNTTSGQVVGVVRFDLNSGKNVLDISAYDSFHSLAFSNKEEGTCCYVYYELDYEDPENTAEKIAANGYYTVTVLAQEEINRFYMLSEADTVSVALPNETPLKDPVPQIGGYVKGILFLGHLLNARPKQVTDWRLSYDREHMSVDENGENVYDVYLRATIRSEGTTTAEDMYETSAYDMTPYIENAARLEKNLGKDKVSIRVNYVSDINDDGTVVWDRAANKIDLGVQMIIPETVGNSLN